MKASIAKLALLLAATPAGGDSDDRSCTDGAGGDGCSAGERLEWEDGPASWEEFGHDNAACGLSVLTVEEWEAGRYWEGSKPVLVKNVTDGWAAMTNWKKQEMLRLYHDAEATMGEARLMADVGPDSAGSILTPTTIKEFVTKHNVALGEESGENYHNKCITEGYDSSSLGSFASFIAKHSFHKDITLKLISYNRARGTIVSYVQSFVAYVAVKVSTRASLRSLDFEVNTKGQSSVFEAYMTELCSVVALVFMQ